MNFLPIGLRFAIFEHKINPATWKCHDGILAWANEKVSNSNMIEQEQNYLNSDDKIVRQGYLLINKLKDDFRNKYLNKTKLKILIHVPDPKSSPGGYSLFNNLYEGLDYIGVLVKKLEWNEQIESYLDTFKPNVFITSDYKQYLDRINWQVICDYKKKNALKVGLTASIAEYGNTPLLQRLDWAKKNAIDFYYSFRSPEYLSSRKEYKPFFENGYKVFSVEFGANILRFYPVPNILRDLDYSFMASVNPTKWCRYINYFKNIMSKNVGFIDGPGWKKIKTCNQISGSPDVDRYIYSRTKIGLNLHLKEQIDWPSEVNERTYMLAVCGVPQLIDNPKLLGMRFPSGCLFIAETPEKYTKLFRQILNGEINTEENVLRAQAHVINNHTNLHRAESFVSQLNTIMEDNRE